jgi:hypothetical protein
MTYQATGYVRDYNATSDTATVELIGIGIIDTWLDGCAINAGVNRGYLTHGAQVLISIPDAHRLCEATIISINGAGGAGAGTGTTIPSSGGTQRIQTGRARIATNGAGGGFITVVFPIAYTVAPQLSAGADEFLPLQIGIPTTTQFTLTLAAGTAPANSNIYCTWYALGGA